MDCRSARAHTELLIIRLRRGETGVFSGLVDLWEKRLFYFIRRIVSHEEDAWDVLQETWVKVHANVRRLENPSAFPAWVYQIARRSAISHLRKSRRFDPIEEDDPRLALPDGTDTYTFSEHEAELIHWGLDQLLLPQREALTLFFLEGFSLSEIADITHASTGTIKSRLHYGKKKLTSRMRISLGVGGLLGIIFAIRLGYAAWAAPAEIPLTGRLLFGAGALFGAIWAGLSACILKKGSFNIRTDTNATQALMWIFMVLMMTAFLIIGGSIEDRVLGIFMVLYGLVFFVAFAIPAIFSLRMNRMEMGVREQLLRMEITLLEIAGTRGGPATGISPATTSTEHENERYQAPDRGDGS